MRTIRLCIIGLLAVAVFSQSASAHRFKLPFGSKKSEGQSGESRELTKKAGPWLIMCASFVGEDGKQQAQRLAAELSDQHRLKTYVYVHEFDLNPIVADQGLGFEVFEDGGQKRLRPKRMKPASASQITETAVLVGEFASVEDNRDQKTLTMIKTLKPESMVTYDKVGIEKDSTSVLRAWRNFSMLKSDDPNDRIKGPMKAAFMMPNPMLPDEYFQARKTDDVVISWNRGSKYSLLKNKSMYTVKIASFSGDSTMELEEIAQTRAEESWRQKNGSPRTESKLVKKEKKATVLTDYLRKQGVEAYEFHDRYESYVCVGGYDWLKQNDEKGVDRQNPEMVKMIEKFKGSPANLPGRPNAIRSYSLPSKLAKAGIACDLQPVPVGVPQATEETASGVFSRFK